MLPDVLALFDAADPNGVTVIRNETTVASQGLFLLNHPFVRTQARTFAQRLLASNEMSSDAERIDLAHQLAYGRSASDVEKEETTEFLDVIINSPLLGEKPENEKRLAGWQAFCQSLLCSNEFLYIE